MVFIELKRREKQFFYFRNKGECDFVVSENKQIENIIQVCYELNQDNMKREINGLKEAMDELVHQLINSYRYFCTLFPLYCVKN